MGTAIKWTLIGLFVLGALSTVAQVGKPRQPIQPTVAVVTVLIDMLLIAWLLLAPNWPVCR